MRRAHGDSNYTPTKQRHLQMICDGCTNGWRSLCTLKPDSLLVVIDSTAGSGHSKEGAAGLPLILNRHFAKHFHDNFRQLCCEKDKPNFENLSKESLVNCDIIHGEYQQVILPWLCNLRWSGRFHGLIYCDPNGIVDALAGVDLFKQLQSDYRFDRIDLLFNISLNAYKRHKSPGVIKKTYHDDPPEWLTVPLIEHLDNLAALKKATYIRSEEGRLLEFIMLYGMNTAKVSLKRSTENIVHYEEWRKNAEKYLNGGIKVSPFQKGLFDESPNGL